MALKPPTSTYMGSKMAPLISMNYKKQLTELAEKIKIISKKLEKVYSEKEDLLLEINTVKYDYESLIHDYESLIHENKELKVELIALHKKYKRVMTILKNIKSYNINTHTQLADKNILLVKENNNLKKCCNQLQYISPQRSHKKSPVHSLQHHSHTKYNNRSTSTSNSNYTPLPNKFKKPQSYHSPTITSNKKTSNNIQLKENDNPYLSHKKISNLIAYLSTQKRNSSTKKHNL